MEDFSYINRNYAALREEIDTLGYERIATIDGRVTSTLANPNVLAEYLVMVLPFVAAYFLPHTNAGLFPNSIQEV